MLFLSVALADCPAISPLLDHAREALLDERIALAQSDLATVEAAFSCASVYPDQLARFYLLNGAVYQIGNTGDPTLYYVASRRLMPEPDLQLGMDIVATFRAAPELAGQASLLLEPSQSAWLDGKLVPAGPVSVAPGLHFVQIRDEKDEVLFARLLTLEANQEVRVATGLEPAVVAESEKKRSFPVLLVGGVVLAGAGTGMALRTMQQNDRIEAAYQACLDPSGACDQDGFWQAGKAGDVLTVGAYTLWGLGAAGIVLEFVLPVRAEEDAFVEPP